MTKDLDTCFQHSCHRITTRDKYRTTNNGLAEISATKHKSGPKKISVAEEICGRIFYKFIKKWQKSGQIFSKYVLHIKMQDILLNPLMFSTFFNIEQQDSFLNIFISASENR
jgi:hypothetical protein